MNQRFLLALGLSAGLALVVAMVFYNMVDPSGSADGGPTQEREIVVAVNDLEIGGIIQASDLRVIKWPADMTPEGAYSSPEEIVERVPSSSILANEPITDRRLAPPGSGFGLAPKVPPGMRAITVRVDDVSSVAGFVLPEMRVDVLVTGQPTAQQHSGQMTRTILSNVKVIGAGEQLEPDTSGRAQRVSTVTFLVNPDQAEMLTLASTKGRLRLVLRNARDDEIAETKGIFENEIFLPGWTPQPAPTRVAQTASIAPRQLPPPPLPPPAIEVYRGAERSEEVVSQARSQ